ncbi:hypothetical protein [Methylobacterium aerolatum]|uniref:Phage gp36 major capsid-like protein n=1 Tax=Methylobacterium aerolatum TaxID=418708 RepID=A0ABU0HY61_9HYPH|nr:hypothetical protein [Methylobacterium aerolatum]MDQ0447279.1 putative phage gp36 major capsid-like protein [Methylobacterium aerolatum]GJD36945.1 hypothetical protein FMGBMHLM_3870 [Methylobacterium aerolatum]
MIMMGTEMTRAEMRIRLDEMSEEIRKLVAEHRELLRASEDDTLEEMADLDHELAELEAMRDIIKRVEAGGLGKEERTALYARLLSMTQMDQLRALPTPARMN